MLSLQAKVLLHDRGMVGGRCHHRHSGKEAGEFTSPAGDSPIPVIRLFDGNIIPGIQGEITEVAKLREVTVSTAKSIKFVVFALLASPAVWSASQEATPPVTTEERVTKPVEPESVPIDPAPAVASAPAPIVVSFLDFEAFDDDLNTQLKKANDRNVEVEFYSPVSPNAIPPRIERRLAALRKDGGSVGIVQPQNASNTRSVMAVVGLFSGLYNFMKTFEAASNERAMVNSVKGRDVDLVLERTDQGTVVIRKLVFKKRPPAPPESAPSATD
jgi:hypothetical protein